MLITLTQIKPTKVQTKKGPFRKVIINTDDILSVHLDAWAGNGGWSMQLSTITLKTGNGPIRTINVVETPAEICEKMINPPIVTAMN